MKMHESVVTPEVCAVRAILRSIDDIYAKATKLATLTDHWHSKPISEQISIEFRLFSQLVANTLQDYGCSLEAIFDHPEAFSLWNSNRRLQLIRHMHQDNASHAIPFQKTPKAHTSLLTLI